MEKPIFEETGGTYHEKNGYLIPNLTTRRRKVYRNMGTETQTLPERVLSFRFSERFRSHCPIKTAAIGITTSTSTLHFEPTIVRQILYFQLPP